MFFNENTKLISDRNIAIANGSEKLSRMDKLPLSKEKDVPSKIINGIDKKDTMCLTLIVSTASDDLATGLLIHVDREFIFFSGSVITLSTINVAIFVKPKTKPTITPISGSAKKYEKTNAEAASLNPNPSMDIGNEEMAIIIKRGGINEENEMSDMNAVVMK